MVGAGEGDDSTVAQAIDWCVSKNVNIISLSLGGMSDSNYFRRCSGGCVENAYEAGIVVAAAGNDGQNDDGDVSSPGIVDTELCRRR